MQAIQTKFFGPTNTKGSRVKATAPQGSVTVGYDHALDGEGNHVAAAHALKAKLGWLPAPNNYYSDTVCGQLADGTYVHVFTKP